MDKTLLIVIGGFAGAGKTTVANKLSKEHKYPIFSSDTINDALRPELNKSFKEVSPIAYKLMWYLIRRQLLSGINVIVDAHMAADHLWQSLDNLKLEMPQIQIIPIILIASLSTHKARIEERGISNKAHLNLGGDNIEDVLFKYEYIKELDRTDLIRVDANHSMEEVYGSVELFLKNTYLSKKSQ